MNPDNSSLSQSSSIESLRRGVVPDDVNKAQWKAISFDKGSLLIVAGPGTGKTHTLTYRIARFTNQLNDNQKVLAITFTNKAADEMQERLELKFPEVTKNVVVGTFHSFCLQFLRNYITLTELPQDFHIADPVEIEVIVQEAFPELTKKQCKDKIKEIAGLKTRYFDDEYSDEVEHYNGLLREKGLLDYDDLLLETYKLLKENWSILFQLQRMYPYIFVDEYQDINMLQHELLKLFVGDSGKVTAIGDPNQAIYSFRGSDVRFFENFSEDFADSTVFALSENYRSAANLLKASGQIISKSDRFAVPDLTAQMYSEGNLTIHMASTGNAEAEYVIHQIEKLIGGISMFSQDSGRVENDDDADYSFGDIAVLYRLNYQRKALETAFKRSGIPYQISGEKPHQVDDTYIVQNEKVNLLTIHAAKGLEFPAVFIVGCEDRILPLNLEGLESDEEEERRLFYVGMTRAKKRLYLTRAKKRQLFGKYFQNEPSAFLSDIEEELKNYEMATTKKKKSKSDQLNLFEKS